MPDLEDQFDYQSELHNINKELDTIMGNIDFIDKRLESFDEGLNHLWNVKFKAYPYAYIDTDNINVKNKFIRMMKSNGYIKELENARRKLNKRKRFLNKILDKDESKVNI